MRQIRVALGSRAKRPEQLLVAFKSLLSEVANDAKLSFGEERSALFVTAFIDELYKPPGTIGTPADVASCSESNLACRALLWERTYNS